MTSNIDHLISNVDLQDFISQVDKKGVNIVKAESITPNTDIEEIFKNRGHCVLHHGPNNRGHWLTMLRTPEKKVYFIDSFAEHSNRYNKDIVQCMKNNNVKDILINDTQLQDEKSVTCGRYPIIFIACHKMGVKPSDTIDFIIDGGKAEQAKAKNKNKNDLYKYIDKFMLELTKEL